jgi:hypothetical protein
MPRSIHASAPEVEQDGRTGLRGASSEGPHSRAASPGRIALRLLTAAWTALVLILSFLPYRQKHRLHTGGALHAWGHLLAFAVLMYLAAGSVGSWRRRGWLVLAVLLLGAGVELVEHLVFGAPIEWIDIGVDAAGVALGVGAAWLSR